MNEAEDFRSSIRMLAERAGSVPAGWRQAYQDALVAFSAVDCPGRREVMLIGPFVDDISLRVSANRVDRVVIHPHSVSRRVPQPAYGVGAVGISVLYLSARRATDHGNDGPPLAHDKSGARTATQD